MDYDPRDIAMLPPGPQPYKVERKSNYEGFKGLDRILEGVDSGLLKLPDKSNREPVRDIYCPLCHYRKKSRVMVQSELLGFVVHTGPFRGKKVIECCADCARDMSRAVQA